MVKNRRSRLEPQEYIDGILAHNPFILSRAITLIESQLESDNELATQIIDKLMPYTGNSIRVGVTGVPGVGKSTFIETFGLFLTELNNQNKKVAVLAIDPSSQRSGGSILGDKTRMEKLSNHKNAYIRPSPARSSLGGVSQKTRETMLLCEAAGFDIILIETVGVGQSETIVKGMVDFFLLLMLAGAGDELQGIKRGIMEMADMLVITKADGENKRAATRAKSQYKHALHLFPPNEAKWTVPVEICSALKNEGVGNIWKNIENFVNQTFSNGFFKNNRSQQNKEWLHQTIEEHLKRDFYKNNSIKNKLLDLEKQVANGNRNAVEVAKELLENYYQEK
ncbi:methylmalonyl-CoA mutase metallochaperone MeaB [Bernardetia litoralis DSM 6794]|uniref:Methylmalonyl-CoA mutase metallochaperone MeaB n=1 Tax=Bernardetia litoralis (strain ATCC 23117 / DSM 6794 / NBRC 15988 / NCIMB 1366 / Fx l1 / Sio-4) TaxID=880071 RepID=I4AN63_BERLS|nr:methylmalonyl Co-A mutase-associated GTPase MeaB [Bernardetia litoralis]AFM05398.1 methylmalonyl-CoA mutase metallochaperone MeaB [Bernardetia litoralis DSM 6794]